MGSTKNIYPISDIHGDLKDFRIAETSFGVTDESVAFFTLNTEKDEPYYKITPLKVGSTHMTVKVLNSKTNVWYLASYIIDVVDVSSITIPSTLNLTVGETFTFTPIITDYRCHPILKWTSSDTDIATVTTDHYTGTPLTLIKGGKVTAIKPGKSTIMCQYHNITATCELTVGPKYISKITFNDLPESIEEFETLKADVTIAPSDATIQDVSWKSSNTDVAIVDGSGNILGLKEGQTAIIATAKDGSGVFCSHILKVKPATQQKFNVTFGIDDYTQLSTDVVKDNSFIISVLPSNNKWKIETLTENGKNILDQLSTDGVYTIEKVNEPKAINISYSFDGDIQFVDMVSTDVSNEIIGSDIKITKTDSNIQLSNLTPNSSVKIYTVNGMLIADHTASSYALSINIEPGIYIIAVDSLYFKVKI